MLWEPLVGERGGDHSGGDLLVGLRVERSQLLTKRGGQSTEGLRIALLQPGDQLDMAARIARFEQFINAPEFLPRLDGGGGVFDGRKALAQRLGLRQRWKDLAVGLFAKENVLKRRMGGKCF